VLQDSTSILKLKQSPVDKVVCINPYLQDSAAMPYAIDKPASNLSLKEMTEVAIANLYDDGRERSTKNGNGWHRFRSPGDKGFFIMVEGGKIDWACHANDAKATIGDMLDFDDAVGVALDFYAKHPLETLIVVTGDHETGGMSVGHATTAYGAYYDRLLGQRNSFQFFRDKIWLPHKAATASKVCGSHTTVNNNLVSDTTMLGYLTSEFGISYGSLNDYQKEKLEDAYDFSMCGGNNNTKPENDLLYGGYDAIIVSLTHILNEQASIGWTSYAHTGMPVPVFAEGWEGWRFAGFYDNTDIAKKLAAAIGSRLPANK
jgi:alkaline phosphatase